MDASLKQRLVGAAVLVALAVIFLPMLVKGPAPESGVSGVSLRVPQEPQDTTGATTQDLPLVAPAPAPAAGVAGMPAAVVQPPAPAEVADLAVPAEAAAGGDFAVSFGNYASGADADKVIAALRAAGLSGYREAVSVAGKPAQRVRIGPFADQASAEAARLRARQVRSDVDVRVVALDAPLPAATAQQAVPASASVPAPVAAAPAAVIKQALPEAPPAPAKQEPAKQEPAKPAQAKPEPVKPLAKAEPAPSKPANPAGTGFVVQIGAFASAGDANAQRDALRKAGFNSFTDTVPGASGRLTRVRVGPVISRAEAEALKARVKDKTGKDGMIRPHP